MVKHVYPTPWLRWRKYGNVMLFYTAHRKTSTFTEHAHGAWNRIWITQTSKQCRSLKIKIKNNMKHDLPTHLPLIKTTMTTMKTALHLKKNNNNKKIPSLPHVLINISVLNISITTAKNDKHKLDHCNRHATTGKHTQTTTKKTTVISLRRPLRTLQNTQQCFNNLSCSK